MGTTSIDQVPAQPRGRTHPVRTPPVPPKVRRPHMCLRLPVAAVIAVSCALLTTACSSGPHNSALPSPTELSSSGGPTGPGSSVTAPASQTPSTLPTYNPSSVSQAAKPKQSGSPVISLGNIGSPTVDSTHPNGSAGHLIPYAGASSSPHCILVYNEILPQALTIVSVSFHVDVPGSGTAGPLQFADQNTDQNCGWLSGGYAAPSSVRSPTCGGKTLPPLPLTGPPFSGPGCVLRLDIPAPASNVERTGHFTFILQTQCVDRTVAPCDRLAGQPTPAHPVTVQWSPGLFYVVFCGNDPVETQTDAAAGECVYPSPSAATSPTSPATSSSATPSPSS
jgi:hypothetical protein